MGGDHGTGTSDERTDPPRMKSRDAWNGMTLVASVATVAWLGLDPWILKMWALVLVVLVVLAVVGRLLARELELGGPSGSRTHRPSWWTGGIAAFISCTMAAALVRSGLLLVDFWLLGLLMVMGVISLRLAYV